MKKVYEAPEVEIELYELNASIANNCIITVKNGPQMGQHEECENYEDPFATWSKRSGAVHNVNFYEDTECDCYTTGGNGSYWTS